MEDRAAETGAAVPPRGRTSSESPAEAVGPGRRGTGREEDGEEERRRTGGPDGSGSKRRESGARAESAGRREGDESGDGACGSTARERGEPRDGAPVGGGERPELRVVLLGRSGAGRSATGNTLLCREQFASQLASRPVTTACAEGRRDWKEWSVVVMDTPAIFGGSQWDEQQSATERERCRDFAARERCVLVLVAQLGRYTREDREVQKSVQKFFGKGAKERMMVVFTRKEDLGGGSLQGYVRTADNGALRKLVEACGARYCAVSNRGPRRERDAQADEVLQMARGIACGQHEGPRHKRVWPVRLLGSRSHGRDKTRGPGPEKGGKGDGPRRGKKQQRDEEAHA